MDEYGYSAFEGATDPETAADCKRNALMLYKGISDNWEAR